MRYIGPVQTGTQETTADQLEIVAGGVTVIKYKSDEIDNLIVSGNPSTITQNSVIPTGSNVVMAGPITVDSTATLTVSGLLTII